VCIFEICQSTYDLALQDCKFVVILVLGGCREVLDTNRSMGTLKNEANCNSSFRECISCTSLHDLLICAI
jgi:hypothetical protein